MTRMLCAWCGCVIRDGDLPISHGLCSSCERRYFGGPSKADYLWSAVIFAVAGGAALLGYLWVTVLMVLSWGVAFGLRRR